MAKRIEKGISAGSISICKPTTKQQLPKINRTRQQPDWIMTEERIYTLNWT